MVAGFIGVTSEERRDGALTLGIEYARRISGSFSMGLIAEHAFGDEDFSVYAVPFAYHHGQWKIYAAPGVEDSTEHGNEFLMRIGVEYGFEVGKVEIGPQLNLDVVDGDAVLVLGVTIGKAF